MGSITEAVVRGKPGRPKGSPNKIGAAAKDAIALVFDELGGPQALKEWVEASDENRTIFYSKIYPKLIPVQVSGEDGGPVTHAVVVRFI